MLVLSLALCLLSAHLSSSISSHFPLFLSRSLSLSPSFSLFSPLLRLTFERPRKDVAPHGHHRSEGRGVLPVGDGDGGEAGHSCEGRKEEEESAVLPMLFEPGQYLKRSVCAGMYAGMYAYVVCMCVEGEVW